MTDDWGSHADDLQRALTRSFELRLVRGRYRRLARPRLLRAFGFDYWWVAHVVEARLDAFERTGDPAWRDSALRAFEYARRRTRGLVVDWFDDMGWMTIAALRLGRRDDAEMLWRTIVDRGWNDRHGPSVAWRGRQLDYKNAPSNGALAIASLRLHAATGDARYLDVGLACVDWLDRTLVDPSGIVLDGVNRTGDGRVDADWVFSYNQGLWIGALVEEHDRTGDDEPLARAARTALAYIARFAPDGDVAGEQPAPGPGGGDAGLFRGILVRYVARLVLRMPPSSDREALDSWLRAAADTVWRRLPRPSLVASPYLSGHLSAVITAEARALLT